MKTLLSILLFSLACFGQSVVGVPSSNGGGGTSGPVTGCTTSGTNVIQKSDGAGGCVASSLTDDGNTLASPEGLALGTSPPALTAGTGGADAHTEGTAPGIGPTAGVDVCYSDSTQHGELCNYNNAGYLPRVLGPASATNGHIAIWSGTNGGKLIDGGAAGNFDPAGTTTLTSTGIIDASAGQLKYTPQAPFFGLTTADSICAATGGTLACPSGGASNQNGAIELGFAHYLTLPANTPAAGRGLSWTTVFDVNSNGGPTVGFKIKACEFSKFTFAANSTPVCSSGGVTLLTSLNSVLTTTSNTLFPGRYDCTFGVVTVGTVISSCNNSGMRGFSGVVNPSVTTSVPMTAQWVIYLTTTWSAATANNWVAMTQSVPSWVY